MKRIILILALTLSNMLIVELANCQSPQKFNYQGIARDVQGNPLGKKQLALKLSVLPTADATVAEYEETQLVTTNEFGLYTLQIGNGTATLGEMKTVKWETGNKYIKVAIDPTGGTNYVDAGTTQLLSVPYAIYADKAGVAKETIGSSHSGTRTGTVSSNAAHVAGDANYVTKFTGLNLIGKSLIYDNGTNVGIGTTAPAAKLNIVGASIADMRLTSNGATASDYASMQLFNNAGTSFGFTKASSAGGLYTAGIPRPHMALFANRGSMLFNATGNIAFATLIGSTNFTRMFIDSVTGNVGIGTVTPGAKLEVVGQVKITGGTPGAGKVLTSDATGLATWQTPAAGGGGITGSGTLNYIPKFTPSGTVLGNSKLYDNGSGLLYNATSFPGASVYSAYHRVPASAGSSTQYTIHNPNPDFIVTQNYLALSTNGSNNLEGIVFGDSAGVNAFWGIGDSLGLIFRRGTDNAMYMGGAYGEGLSVNNQTGKMRNGNIFSMGSLNAHLTIESEFDTAAYFSSTSALNNSYGTIGEASSSNYAIGVQGNAFYTGTGNPSFTYGGQFNSSGFTQDAYGLSATASNDSSGSGFVIGSSNLAFQIGFGEATGVSSAAIIDNPLNIANSVAGDFFANSTGTGLVSGVRADASGGDVSVIGVYGKATGHFNSTGNNNPYGVFGEADGGLGNSDATYGVYGTASNAFLSNNYAGYFNGNTHINGALSKLSGTFKIDHPQDPANKFLVHSFVESPDMMNVYNGNIITDANGVATVNLPSYFEAENKEFKYQLTVIDNSSDFVMAKVSKKVNNNTFEVKTSKPNVEVSWQVTGVRQDEWANANRVVAEVEKNDREKGKYLTPELFGKDKSLGLHYHPPIKNDKDQAQIKKEKLEQERIIKMMDINAKKAAIKLQAEEKAKAEQNKKNKVMGRGAVK